MCEKSVVSAQQESKWSKTRGTQAAAAATPTTTMKKNEAVMDLAGGNGGGGGLAMETLKLFCLALLYICWVEAVLILGKWTKVYSIGSGHCVCNYGCIVFCVATSGQIYSNLFYTSSLFLILLETLCICMVILFHIFIGTFRLWRHRNIVVDICCLTNVFCRTHTHPHTLKLKLKLIGFFLSFSAHFFVYLLFCRAMMD